jgi:hypothetical protein
VYIGFVCLWRVGCVGWRVGRRRVVEGRKNSARIRVTLEFRGAKSLEHYYENVWRCAGQLEYKKFLVFYSIFRSDNSLLFVDAVFFFYLLFVVFFWVNFFGPRGKIPPPCGTGAAGSLFHSETRKFGGLLADVTKILKFAWNGSAARMQ